MAYLLWANNGLEQINNFALQKGEQMTCFEQRLTKKILKN